MQPVGPLNAVLAKPLAEDLRKFLDTPVKLAPPAKAAQPAGAVYVALGTVVRLSVMEVTSLAANLVALNRPVIWSLDPEDLSGGLLEPPHLALLASAAMQGAFLVEYQTGSFLGDGVSPNENQFEHGRAPPAQHSCAGSPECVWTSP